MERLRSPKIRVDHEATHRLADLAEDILGGILEVRIKTMWWWSLGMTRLLIELRGFQQVMYDMTDDPGIVHCLMTILRDGTMEMLDQLEEQSLLGLNSDGSYVGSGGLGWSDELPQTDFAGRVRTCDMWGFSESQETVLVSPAMFAEFIFPYQVPIMERFGLNCYGCCEPLDARWDVVKQAPRLRRVSVSPWANLARMAEMLEDRYILSLKPSPTDLAMEVFDEGRVRTELREALHVARGCHLEIIMKDNHTIRNDPRRVIRWVEIAREEADRL
jgi:hypothetical protein